MSVESLKASIRGVPDFPKPGILFYDVTTLMKDPPALAEAVDRIVERFRGEQIDVVSAIEARGFVFGGAIAKELGVGFVPVRKPGKLPADTISRDYELEYGLSTLHLHKDAIQPGSRVLLVDDLLATGGTVGAAISLLQELGGEVAAVAVVVDLVFLHGERPFGDIPVFSLVEYDSE